MRLAAQGMAGPCGYTSGFAWLSMKVTNAAPSVADPTSNRPETWTVHQAANWSPCRSRQGLAAGDVLPGPPVRSLTCWTVVGRAPTTYLSEQPADTRPRRRRSKGPLDWNRGSRIRPRKSAAERAMMRSCMVTSSTTADTVVCSSMLGHRHEYETDGGMSGRPVR